MAVAGLFLIAGINKVSLFPWDVEGLDVGYRS